MKKTALFIFAAVIGLTMAGCLSMPQTSVRPVVTVVNNTGYTCFYLYLSPSSTDNWEEDVLGNDILENGQSVRVHLSKSLSQENIYDIMMVDEDGDTYTKWNVQLTENARILFTMRDFDRK